jgi:hypothetical protein
MVHWCLMKNVYIVPLKETKNKMRMDICMTCIGRFIFLVLCDVTIVAWSMWNYISPYMVKCDQGIIASNSSSRGNHDKKS